MNSENPLVDLYGDVLRFIKRKIWRNSWSAEDLAQEVYLRILRYPRDSITNPRTYLNQVAANVIADFARADARDPVMFNVETANENADRDVDLTDNETEARAAEKQVLLWLIGRLPPMWQAVLILCERDGLSYKEVGAVLDISPNTVNKHRTKAIKRCTDEWERISKRGSIK